MNMSTGDLRNNIRKLQVMCKQIKFPDELDLDGLSKGIPEAFLSVYHYAFTTYSHAVAEEIIAHGVELFGKNDRKFIEGVYKIMRELYSYKPSITRDQFFSAGFTERKIIMCTEIMGLLINKHKHSLTKRPQEAAAFKITTLTGLGVTGNMEKTDTKRCKSAPVAHVPRSDRPPTASIAPRKVATVTGAVAAARPKPQHAAEPRSSRPTSRNSPRSPPRKAALPQAATSPPRKIPPPQPPTTPVNNIYPMSRSATRDAANQQLLANINQSPQTKFGLPTSINIGGACIPVTPSIRHAQSGAVEIVCIPRGEWPVSEEPIDIVAASPARPGGHEYEGANQFLDDDAPDVTKPAAMDRIPALEEKVKELEEKIVALQTAASVKPATTPADSAPSSGKPDMAGVLKQLLGTMDTLKARTVLLENKVAMVDAKLESVCQATANSSASQAANQTPVINGLHLLSELCTTREPSYSDRTAPPPLPSDAASAAPAHSDGAAPPQPHAHQHSSVSNMNHLELITASPIPNHILSTSQPSLMNDVTALSDITDPFSFNYGEILQEPAEGALFQNIGRSSTPISEIPLKSDISEPHELMSTDSFSIELSNPEAQGKAERIKQLLKSTEEMLNNQKAS